MKIGIVGIGAVGAATAMAIAVRARVRELVLVNRNRVRAKGVATDMRYATPLTPVLQITDGDYSDLEGAGVVVIAAGVNEKAGGATDRKDSAGRLRLLAPNAAVFNEIVPKIVAAAPQAVIVVATDPPEPLAAIARALARHDRVLGTGTYLDSLRFRVHLAERLNVNPASVEAYVIGEHGTSSVFLWSGARVGGMKVQDILAQRHIAFDEFKQAVEHDVRYANIAIIEGIGASQYGIGVVTARIAEAVLWNEQTVMPVSSYSPRFNTTISLPGIVGSGGVSGVLLPEMSDQEADSLRRSADILNSAVSPYITLPRAIQHRVNG